MSDTKKRGKRGRAKGTPGYLRHRDKERGDRAFVLLDGKRVYLGKYGTPESRAAYDRAVAEFLANGRLAKTAREASDAAGPFVVEIIAAYWEHAKTYYRHEDGTPTGEVERNVRYALRPLRNLYGNCLASDFGPSCLEALRAHLVESGLSRVVVNKRVGVIRRMFRWAESKEMVPRGTFHNLATLEPLKAGRTSAPETERVRPVSWQDVEATVKHLSPQVAAMVLLQWESAMRPGEVVCMRACDIDRSDPSMWIYEPAQHKNKHRGKERPIPLFAKSQGYLRPFIENIEVGKNPTRFLFTPEGPKARHGCYSTTHYAQAIRRGVAAANAPALQHALLGVILPMVPVKARARLERALRRLVTYLEHTRVARAIERQAARFGFDAAPVVAAAQRAAEEHEDAVADWSPNQLRHAAATRIERQLSVEDARIVLGHSSSKMTRHYVDPDVHRAYEALRRLG